jgi:hypothetical protein
MVNPGVLLVCLGEILRPSLAAGEEEGTNGQGYSDNQEKNLPASPAERVGIAM